MNILALLLTYFFLFRKMCKVDTHLINLVVKASENREFHFRNQRMGSFDDVIEFIKSEVSLAQFIIDNTTFLGNDKQALSPQHLEAAKESGILKITLSS